MKLETWKWLKKQPLQLEVFRADTRVEGGVETVQEGGVETVQEGGGVETVSSHQL